MYEKDFKHFKNSYSKNMQKMFAAVSNLYAEYWNDLFHFALFDKNNESWAEAFKKTHKKYIKDLKIARAKKVLDLSCGRGGFTNILAQNTQGDVLGIDISASQLSHTSIFNRTNLRFKQHDVMKIDELKEKFDAVSYLDAECYLPDKNLALSKISKIMQSGGRLLIMGWCKQSGLNNIQEDLVLHPFMKYWAIPSLETKENYQKYFRQNGFKILKIEDMNHKVKRDWEFGYESALNGIKRLGIKDLPRLLWKRMIFGKEGLRLIKEQFPAAIYIKVGFDTGFLRYKASLIKVNPPFVITALHALKSP